MKRTAPEEDDRARKRHKLSDIAERASHPRELKKELDEQVVQVPTLKQLVMESAIANLDAMTMAKDVPSTLLAEMLQIQQQQHDEELAEIDATLLTLRSKLEDVPQYFMTSVRVQVSETVRAGGEVEDDQEVELPEEDFDSIQTCIGILDAMTGHESPETD